MSFVAMSFVFVERRGPARTLAILGSAVVVAVLCVLVVALPGPQRSSGFLWVLLVVAMLVPVAVTLNRLTARIPVGRVEIDPVRVRLTSRRAPANPVELRWPELAAVQIAAGSGPGGTSLVVVPRGASAVPPAALDALFDRAGHGWTVPLAGVPADAVAAALAAVRMPGRPSPVAPPGPAAAAEWFRASRGRVAAAVAAVLPRFVIVTGAGVGFLVSAFTQLTGGARIGAGLVGALLLAGVPVLVGNLVRVSYRVAVRIGPAGVEIASDAGTALVPVGALRGVGVRTASSRKGTARWPLLAGPPALVLDVAPGDPAAADPALRSVATGDRITVPVPGFDLDGLGRAVDALRPLVVPPAVRTVEG
ncbi:hypothetical protein GCM10009836_30240 [Pseudonocardia ailaonensis]|uniref:PH domain-containing protein n=1 Tax=Pseudonocardia ailaonensis TaxID=367279 RepID=A0ABN2N2X2_9PSEU